MVSSFLVRGVDVASETESEPDGHGRYGRSLAVFEQVGQSVVAVDVEAVETRPGGDTRIEWIHVHAVSLLLRKLYLRMAAYAHPAVTPSDRWNMSERPIVNTTGT